MRSVEVHTVDVCRCDLCGADCSPSSGVSGIRYGASVGQGTVDIAYEAKVYRFGRPVMDLCANCRQEVLKAIGSEI